MAENIDISNIPSMEIINTSDDSECSDIERPAAEAVLIVFLKRMNVGHIPKKSKILTKDDINKFILEADDDQFLLMKVALVLGIGGGCRRCELTKLSVKDVVDSGEYLHIVINDTKTYEPRDFVITEGGLKYNLLGIVRKYMALPKVHTPNERFFVGYRNGQCSTQPVGINTIGAIPKRIATFCGLKDPELYTGYCFRRSSATFLADAGADLYVIKKHYGWKSVATGYIQSSVASKRKIAVQILGKGAARDSSTNVSDVDAATMNTVPDNIASNNNGSPDDAAPSDFNTTTMSAVSVPIATDAKTDSAAFSMFGR